MTAQHNSIGSIFNGIVSLKMKILLLVTRAHVVPNLHEFLCSVEHQKCENLLIYTGLEQQVTEFTFLGEIFL